MNIVNTNHLIYESIIWEKHFLNERYFYSTNNGKLLLLRLNNFPDEPLLTLIDGLNIFDLEDVPDNWIVPFN